MNNINYDGYISSPHNERAKEWSSLLDKKYRDRQKRFLIEGVHLVMEALKHDADVLVIVYDAERGIPEELKRLRLDEDMPREVEWVQASRAVIAKCTGTDTPPPVFAVVGKPHSNLESLFASDCFVVALDQVRDPGNVGTIIRSADAVGASAVVLGKGCVDLYNPKTVRSTMGSIFHLPIIEADLHELMTEAKQRGIALIGTSLQAEHTCYSCDWTRPVWLVMGNESEGLSQAVRQQVDESVIIPMVGQAESLNVAMASTIIMYEALRQRQF